MTSGTLAGLLLVERKIGSKMLALYMFLQLCWIHPVVSESLQSSKHLTIRNTGMYICVCSASQMRRNDLIYTYTTETCSELSNPANGTVRWTGLTIGSFAVYTCNDGYQRTGQSIRMCMSNRMWNREEPTCIRKKNAVQIHTSMVQLYLLHIFAHVHYV